MALAPRPGMFARKFGTATMHIRAKRCQLCGRLMVNLLAKYRAKLDERAPDGLSALSGEGSGKGKSRRSDSAW